MKVFTLLATIFLATAAHIQASKVDPIAVTFESCDLNNDERLVLEEMEQDICMDFLVQGFGMRPTELNQTFTQLDTNTDKRISKDEGYTAFNRLGMDRISEDMGEKKCDIRPPQPQQEPTGGNCFDDNTDYWGGDLPGMFNCSLFLQVCI